MSFNAPPFPTPNRIITGHDSNGKAIFLTEELSAEVQISRPENYGSHLGTIYLTTSVPTNVSSKADIEAVRAAESAPFSLTTPNGAHIFTFDMRPGTEGGMHRTESIDFITVLEGEVELSLDSGEKKRVKKGDTVVQRATMHAWKNVTDPNVGGGWSRLLCVLVSADKVKLENGQVLEQDLSELQRMREGK